MDCIFSRAGQKVWDIIAVGSCVAIVVLVATNIFANMSPKMWFSWHPVLMTLAFPCMMTLGRWSYKADPSWGAEEKKTRRTAHGIIMGSATIIAVVGYLCIFMAHLAKKSFFGYDFGSGHWNPDHLRVAHSILGYIVIFAMIFQACVGVAKITKLNTDGIKTMQFHGFLGKVVMVGGAVNMLLAMLFWAFSGMLKLVLIALLSCTFFFAVIAPGSGAESSLPEAQPILMGDQSDTRLGMSSTGPHPC